LTTESPKQYPKMPSREKCMQVNSFEQFKSESLTNLFWNTNN